MLTVYANRSAKWRHEDHAKIQIYQFDDCHKPRRYLKKTLICSFFKLIEWLVITERSILYILVSKYHKMIIQIDES